MQDVKIIEGYVPGCVGRIIELHGRYYSRQWGVGQAFELLMAHELCDFCEDYESGRDGLFTAHIGDELIGAVAILRPRPGEPARLRWFIVAPEHHGQGVGRTLLERALGFCREQGYGHVHLWTTDDRPQALRLYERAGFRVIEQAIDSRYSKPLTNLHMEALLSNQGAAGMN